MSNPPFSSPYKNTHFLAIFDIPNFSFFVVVFSSIPLTHLVMSRASMLDENGLKKGPWTPEEDRILVDYIEKHGHGSWRALPNLAGLNRCGKSCRLRWTNYLRPDIKRGNFSDQEKQIIISLHASLGNK